MLLDWLLCVCCGCVLQVAVVSFAAYVLSDPRNHVLTPSVAFVSLALFNILRFPLSILSGIIGQAVQWLVSNKRLRAFLADEELDTQMVDRSAKDKGTPIRPLCLLLTLLTV